MRSVQNQVNHVIFVNQNEHAKSQTFREVLATGKKVGKKCITLPYQIIACSPHMYCS